MADLKPIEFPEELKRHNLSEQELAPLNEQQKALAKDWNVMKRQMEWLINHQVTVHNLLVDHDKELVDMRFWFKLISLVFGGGAGVVGVVYWLAKSSGAIH